MLKQKRNLWKVRSVFSGISFLLILAVLWISVSAVHAQQTVVRSVMRGAVTVQETPTEDATVTALNKIKLAQEVQQLQEQNEPDFLAWLRINAAILLSTLLVVGGGIFSFLRYLAERRDTQKRLLEDRQAERNKRAEERFQAVVVGLGSKDIEARTGAAIMLRTFLQPGYEQFYQQAFDLAVAHLRLRPVDPKISESLDSLSQALITVFSESFSRARRILEEQPTQLSLQSLDASHIQLDHAFLRQSDLERIWMREAFLRSARLYDAKLREANLRRANLHGGYLNGADLTEADLTFANLRKTHLNSAKLSRADLSSADLSGADLSRADLNGTNLSSANLSKTNIEEALSLKDANLIGVKGLTEAQLLVCKAKDAIIGENLTASSSQSTIAPLLPLQSNNAQIPSIISAQEST